MQHLSVTATLRDKQSHGAMTRQRQTGQIPVSLSGKGMDPVSLSIAAPELQRVLQSKAGMNTLIDLVFPGGKHIARLAKVDRHPITGAVLAVSLQKIAVGETRKATIGLQIIGEPEAVRQHTGALYVLMDHLEVRALSEQMVASIPLDTSALVLGGSIRAGEIALPNGFELLTDGDTVVVAVRAGVLSSSAALADTSPSTPTEGTASA